MTRVDGETRRRMVANALAPDIAKFRTGSEAYDVPASRRDVLSAFDQLIYTTPLTWREWFPVRDTDEGERIDALQLPAWVLGWMLVAAAIPVAFSVVVWVWKWAF